MATAETQEKTGLGNYFVANYPPFAAWKPSFLPDAHAALALQVSDCNEKAILRSSDTDAAAKMGANNRRLLACPALGPRDWENALFAGIFVTSIPRCLGSIPRQNSARAR